MKKNLLSLFLCAMGYLAVCIPCAVMAQGNLQFNRAILVSSAQTVPSGKVWKVESALIANPVHPPVVASTHINANSAIITVNGNAVYVFSSYWAQGTAGYHYDRGPNIDTNTLTVFPFWLPAGNSVGASSNVHYVSVIEFNIVP